jgi:hypothetical protein
MSCQLTMSALDNAIDMLMEAIAESEHEGVAGLLAKPYLRCTLQCPSAFSIGIFLEGFMFYKSMA